VWMHCDSRSCSRRPAAPCATTTSALRGRPSRRPLPSGADVVVAQGAAGLREQLLESQCIHTGTVKRVPVGGADDRVLAERGAQAGDMMMERVSRSGRKLGAPEAVDQHVDADHATVPEREHRQQRLPLRAADIGGRPACEHFERAEKPDFWRLLHIGRRLLQQVSHARALAAKRRRLAPGWQRQSRTSRP